MSEDVIADPEYEAWLRAEIEEALRDESPGIPADDVEAEFARKRARLLDGLAPDPAYDSWVGQQVLGAMEDDGPYFTTEEVNRHMDEVKVGVARKP